MKEGNKSDRIDARKLAELLRTNQLKAVYHEEHGMRALKELGRSYLTITKDVTRVMNRIKALYRSWHQGLCSPSSREWLAKIVEPGVRVRAEHLYQQLDSLHPLRLQARRELLRESYQHPAVKLLRQTPSIGPIRAALLVALLQTPHRFRTKRQLWAYSGFVVETHDSGEYRYVRGKLQRNCERITVRGLNDNHNKDLKNLFKSAAISASTRPGPLHDCYVARVEKGMRPTMARFDTGAEDSHDHLNDMEERSEFRPQTFASASSLSISDEEGFPSLGFSPLVVGRVREMLGSREWATCSTRHRWPTSFTAVWPLVGAAKSTGINPGADNLGSKYTRMRQSLSLSFAFKRCCVSVLRAGGQRRTLPDCGLIAWRGIRLCRQPE